MVFLLAMISSGPKAIERGLLVLALCFLLLALQPREHHQVLIFREREMSACV